jgi:hypothetical protein
MMFDFLQFVYPLKVYRNALHHQYLLSISVKVVKVQRQRMMERKSRPTRRLAIGMASPTIGAMAYVTF